MELLGLVLLVPAAAVVVATYVVFTAFVLTPRTHLYFGLRLASVVPVVLTTLEIVAIAHFGLLRLRELVGNPSAAWHAVFMAVPPSLIHLLLPARPSLRRILLVALVVYIATLGLVLFNIVVSDTLYGPDGVGGPYAFPS